MMSEKNAKTKAYRYVGIVAVLLLIAAAFVGSAAAETYPVSTQEQLRDAVNKLPTDYDVVITLNDDVTVAETAYVKEMVANLTEALYLNNSVSKKLTVKFSTHYISVTKGEHEVKVSGGDSTAAVTIDHKVDGNKPTILTTTGKFSGSAKYGTSYTVTYNGVDNIKVLLERNPDLQFEGDANLLITANATNGVIAMDSLSYSVKKVDVPKQGIWYKKSGSVIELENPVGKTMNAVLTLTDNTVINGEYIEFNANGNIDTRSGEGTITKATVTYTPQGSGTVSTVYLEGVMGKYNNGINYVKGTAKLGSDLKITHVLPVPNFVTEANLWLNGKTLSTTDSNKYFDYKGNIKVKVMSPGFIKKVGSGEYTTQFDKASSYSGKTLQKRNTGDNWEFYVENGGSGGGGGGGGSSVIPTYDPYATPTPTQTWTPVDPFQTGVPTQSPKSPMPVFGILAGLGAAALAGVVLRRK